MKINHYKFSHHFMNDKSLKIQKGQSKAINRKRTGSTMVERKSTKRQTITYKTLHRKLQNPATGTPLKTWDELGCSGRVGSQFVLH